MSQISAQHPAVVLRSHYVHLRALLAIAAIAVVCLSVAVVVLATDDGSSSGRVSSASPASPPAQIDPGLRSGDRPAAKTHGDVYGGRRP